MKKINLISIIAGLFAIGLFGASTAQAGPEPQAFKPVTTQAAAAALAPKTKIAITCPSCGAVTVSTVGKDKAHLKSFECSVCKHSFEIVQTGSGKATTGRLVCKDAKTGKKMPLHMCAEMHK